KQLRAPGTGPARSRGAEVGTQVAEAGGRQQGIADRVRGDVTVRVPRESRLAGPEQGRKIQRPAVTEGMNVGSDAYLPKQARHDDPHRACSAHRDATCT